MVVIRIYYNTMKTTFNDSTATINHHHPIRAGHQSSQYDGYGGYWESAGYHFLIHHPICWLHSKENPEKIIQIIKIMMMT